MAAEEWQRISRTGIPEEKSQAFPGETLFRIYTEPGHDDENWRGIFHSKMSQLGVYAVYDLQDGSRSGMTAACKPGELDGLLEAIDAVIEFANDKYVSEVLPALRSGEGG
jgi:hypothetical protein